MGSNAVRLGAHLATLICIALTPVSRAQTVAMDTPPRSADVRKVLVSISVNNAPLATVLRDIAHQANLNPTYGTAVSASPVLVTIQLKDVPVDEAFARVLASTRLVATIVPGGVYFREHEQTPVAGGGILGTVADAATQRKLQGATITLDDATKGIVSSANGEFRFTSVSAGEHTISVRLLGYVRVTKRVTVVDDQSATVDVALRASANILDQVVVTGTVIPTERKAVPNAMTVITAQDIEQRGITKIDQLFRGDVPGVFALNVGSNTYLDEVTMFSRGATELPTQSTPLGNTNPIKTYVDGIELADPKYLSQIDPRNIERIEILTGPQASTIYGSNAINGVMQIFTKRGTSNTPQLTLNMLSGWVENDFSSARTPQHDYSVQLNGVEGRMSYNAGGSWMYVGPWAPSRQTTRQGAFGGTRLELPSSVGRLAIDVTLRRDLTQNVQRGGVYQSQVALEESGWYTSTLGSSGPDRPATRSLTGQTLGATFSYAPASWWSHELVVGQDVSDVEERAIGREYRAPTDTTLLLTQDHTDRRSLRYATTARVPATSFAQFTATVGADAWQNLTSSWLVVPQTLAGALTGYTRASRQPGHNTGAFLQTQLSVQDRLFVTYGLRAEWNPNYGADAQPNFAPRIGAAYTHEFGPITAKARGSYGRSTRPPLPSLKRNLSIVDFWGDSWAFVGPYFLPYFDPLYDRVLANPELGPERQQGGEGGLELYFGGRGSLVITRYNQTVDALIVQAMTDSVRTSVPCPPSTCFVATSRDAQGYGYAPQFQNLNIGSIRNQGWELQGNATIGPLTTHGTYSWTKSRVIGITPKYRASFADQPQYQPGATFQFLPEHTWALSSTYATGASSVTLSVTGTGRTTVLNDQFSLQHLSSNIRLMQNQLNVNAFSYVNSNPGYPLADLAASHRFGSRIEGVLQVQNLMDRYTNDYSSLFATMGRQVKAGARVRVP